MSRFVGLVVLVALAAGQPASAAIERAAVPPAQTGRSAFPLAAGALACAALAVAVSLRARRLRRLLAEAQRALDDERTLGARREQDVRRLTRTLEEATAHAVDRRRQLPEDDLRTAYSELERGAKERTAELSAVIATLREEIEDRERAEELLRQSEERARAVIDSSLDGIITIDEDGIVETLNPAAERIFGCKESELAGRNVRALMPEPYASEHDGYLRRYRATGERRIVGSRRELVGLRRDGTTFPLEIAVSEMYLGARRLFRGTVRDLTEAKRAAERLAQLQQQLRRSETMAMIGSLVAGFAHEARNPLFGISAVLDAFTARFGEREEYAEHLTMLRRDVKRLSHLMQDLLEFGKPTLELHESPLRPVLEEALAQCRTLSQERGVALEADLRAGEIEVRMNERLVRAFQNVLQNAIQFSPDGGTVRLETDVVHAADGGAVVECRVRDGGPGLRPDDLARLFEPFFTRRAGGTGLGLAIVQRIVEEHGGTVVAANHPAGGAVIALRLPLAASTGQERSRDGEPDPAR